ncbi:MAG: NAD(P)-dependent oxidoreductase [Marinoscillum sp.]
MKILVTGANGLLGQKLVTLLQSQQDVELIATGRGPNRNPEGGYAYLSADLQNFQGLKTFLQLSPPDVIIHCAAMTQVDECEKNKNLCWDLNVKATENLIGIAKELKAFFLYVSTDFVFDGKEGPYKESDMPRPISHYGKSKVAAEDLLHKSQLKYAIVRTVLVYGVAHDPSRSNIVLWVKKNLEDGKPIKVVNDQWRTPTLAEDLAEGCWAITKSKKEGIFHISGEGMVSPLDIANNVANFFELDPGLITAVDASTFKEAAKRPPKTGFIIDKAKRELGFKPKSFMDGLAVVKEQLAKQGHK